VTAHGARGVPLADGAPTAIALRAGAYLTVPAHPSLSFGDASFTVEARVRLDHVASGSATTHEARRYLAVSKPTGSPDERIDWAVLVQAGDLSVAAYPEATGHELALVFADPEIGGHGTWAIVSGELAITDDAWHTLLFRFDAARRHASMRLDDRAEDFDVTDHGHVRSDGPLVIGAHHDARGTFDGFLDGALDGFRLSRGVVPDDALGVRASEPTYDFELVLGAIPLGGDDVTRTIWISNAGTVPTLAIDIDGRATSSDDRVRAELAATRTVTDRVPITIRVQPTRVGPFSANVSIDATVSHYGMRVRGPIGVSVTGEVVAPETEAAEGSAWLRWIVLVLVVSVAALVIARRVRNGSRRA
jgi:hypothetical protein